MQKRTRLPFNPNNNSSVLLIGEGDFSYCCALVRFFISNEAESDDLGAEKGIRKWRVVATALDSRETVLKKYRKARENLLFLEETDSVELAFGVDGTCLHDNRELERLFAGKPMTRVIFNFPHTGAGIKDRERNIVAQQKMLKAFFVSVLRFRDGFKLLSVKGFSYTTTTMKKSYSIDDKISTQKKQKPKVNSKKKKNDDDDEDESDSDMKITDKEFLAYDAKIIKEDDESVLSFDELSEGESFEIHCTFKTGDPYDAWKPKSLASSTGKLVCLQSFRFCPELYPGYQHCRTIGDGSVKKEEIVEADGWNEFLSGKPAKTFVFSLKKSK
jgi:25S rRNA (uracil2634-N3)-methyltransferase